jgi:hypothetical protein
MRLRFIGQFGAQEWLGDFIEQIRTAPADSPLITAQPMLVELTEINEFARRYHHAFNAAADSEPLDAAEVQSYAVRTLAFVGGI